ncbi:MAG TPA: tetratricopeptide repeat protein [Armatimonadota bacterium]|jgi:hypothetical protein
MSRFPSRHRSGGRYGARLLLVSLSLLAACLVASAETGTPSPSAAALPLVSAERYVEAQALLAPYVQTHPEDVGARYWLGRALLGLGQREAALEQFQAVLAQKPASADSRLYLAQALWELRRPEEAQAQLRDLLSRDPGNTLGKALLDRISRGDNPVPPLPPDVAGGQIAFTNGGLALDPGGLDLQTYHLKDYTFSNAPTDWLITSGTWATTNRWNCSPQWSWYGGFADNAPAAIWTKEEFAGDVTVEWYMAYKMGFKAPSGRIYKGPGLVALSMCGDGGNLDSGYTFMVGADFNSSAKIMKGDKVLAETHDTSALFPSWEHGQPSTYTWHRHWWAIRARKQGDRLQLYYENKLVLEARDPAPLYSGRVAVWTYDNGIVVPRLRIFYQNTVRPRTEPAGREAWITPVTEVAPRLLTVTSTSHPSLQADFEYDLGPFRSLGDDKSAVMTLVPGGPSGTGHCLSLINPSGGGSFGALISPDKLDARDYSRLSFDYRVPPAAKVNFYLGSNGRWYEIVFTGREDPSTRCVLLGKIPGVIADNQWHHAEFDLLGALAGVGLAPEQASFSVLHLGNFNNGDLLGAGFGGNSAGCTWYLDNFFLGSPRADRTVKLAVQPAAGQTVAGYAVAVDQNPTGAAGKPVTPPPTEVTASGPGLWYVHVQPTRPDGSAGSTTNYAFRVVAGTPHAPVADPVTTAPYGGGPITLKLDNSGGGTVDPASVKLTVNGQSLSVGQPGLQLDPQTPALRLDPAAAGVVVKAGGSLQIALTNVADRAGNALATPTTLNYTYSAPADHAAPALPVVQLSDPDLCNLTFESGTDGVVPWGGDQSAVAVDPSTSAAPGHSSLRISTLTAGSTCGALLLARPFDAGKYRLLSFDYKVPPWVHVDLGLNVSGQWQNFRFTGTDSPYLVGTIPAVIADNQWHHAELNLFDALRTANPLRTNYQVLQMVIADWGFPASDEGASYWLDNICLSPVVSSASGLQIAWQSAALGGLSGMNYSLDTTPGKELPTTSQPVVSPLKIAAAQSFDGYLTLRALGANGQWSDTMRRRILADKGSLATQILGPAEGTHAAPSEVGLKVAAAAGPARVDPSSLVLSVAGTDYRVDGQVVRYDDSNGMLTWGCERTTPPTVFANGQEVSVALRSAQDFAGNKLATLPAWKWTMDYAQDKTGPALKNLFCLSHPTFRCDTFESGQLGEVAAEAGCQVSVTDQGPASGQKSLLVHKTGGKLIVRLTSSVYAADKYPLLSFDYKLPPAMKVNLAADMLGVRYVWTLTGAGGPNLVPGVVADGQWHRLYVNLTPVLRAARQQGALQVSNLYLIEQGQNAPAGTEFGLDNLTISGVSYGPVSCRWQATDPTGVPGVSYVLTQNPTENPPDAPLDAAASHVFPTPAPGLWFLRIKARDGAGNWGPVETIGVVNRTP